MVLNAYSFFGIETGSLGERAFNQVPPRKDIRESNMMLGGEGSEIVYHVLCCRYGTITA